MPSGYHFSLGFLVGQNVLDIVTVVIFCGLVPALALRYLMRAFRKRPRFQAKNYAGRIVPLGLGFIWPLWACGKVIASLVSIAINSLWNAELPRLLARSWKPMLFSLFAIAVAAAAVFAFGLIDDMSGTGVSKGFKGHLKALAHGRVTTGAIKLVGIGMMALLFACCVLLSHHSGLFGILGVPLPWVVVMLLLGASIALSANFANLCDLRPGRATKVSILMLCVGFFISVMESFAGAGGVSALGNQWVLNLSAELATFLVFLLPMLITLPYDLHERGMLGDAGANPSGFIAGAYIATRLGLIGLVVYFLIMLALNLASEKFSFTRAIERNPLLSRLDQIGRIKTVETDREEEHTD